MPGRLRKTKVTVTVIGSVGVLLAAIDAGKIDEATADEWLSTWIDGSATTSPTEPSRITDEELLGVRND